MRISSWQRRIANDVELGFICLSLVLVVLLSSLIFISKFSAGALLPFAIENEVNVSLQ